MLTQKWTIALLDAPWLMGLLWLVLHAVDWSLTIRGAKAREALRAKTNQPSTHYELNPLFQSDVARLRYFSRRFLVSWLGVAVFFVVAFAAFSKIARDPLFVWIVGALVGMLVFTRIVIVIRHLRNLYLFGRLAKKNLTPTPLDARTNLELSAMMLAEGALLLGLPALATGEAWSAGGAIGLALLAIKHWVLALRAP